jgi:COX assembly protein 1
MAPPTPTPAGTPNDAPTKVHPDTGHPLLKMPSNPTPLSATQEAQVREIYYKNVRAKCGDEIAGQFSSSLHIYFGIIFGGKKKGRVPANGPRENYTPKNPN